MHEIMQPLVQKDPGAHGKRAKYCGGFQVLCWFPVHASTRAKVLYGGAEDGSMMQTHAAGPAFVVDKLYNIDTMKERHSPGGRSGAAMVAISDTEVLLFGGKTRDGGANGELVGVMQRRCMRMF
jgi:hypothetical protein